MAELCGPSNALQNFQKHAAVDRSLQQDRHAPQRPVLESFRSPNPKDVAMEAEYEAFLNARPPDPGLSLESPFNHYMPQLPSQPEADASDWASDFQELNLHGSHAAPPPSSQFRHLAPLQRLGASSWRDEFAGRSSSPGQSNAGLQQPSSTNRLQYGSPYQTPLYQQQSSGPFTHQSVPQQDMALQTKSDEAEAFAKAFEEAEAFAHGALTSTQDTVQTPEPVQATTEPQPTVVAEETPVYRIGSDLIPAPTLRQDSSTNQRDDDNDELAKVAGNLLESVKDDRSTKFKNSQFLSLMRQLRDREVKVEGERVVTVGQELHPGGSQYPRTEEVEVAQSV